MLNTSNSFNKYSALLTVLFPLFVFFVRVFAYESVLFSKLWVVVCLVSSVLLAIFRREEYVVLLVLSVLEFDSEAAPQNYALWILISGLIGKFLRSFRKGQGDLSPLKEVRLENGNALFVFVALLLTFAWIAIPTSEHIFNKNYLIDLNYVIYDLKVWVILIISFILFKNVDNGKIVHVINVAAVAYLIFVTWGIVSDVSSLKVETRDVVGYSAQLTLFLSFYSVGVFYSKRIVDLTIFALLWVVCVISDNVISQNIVVSLVGFAVGMLISDGKKIKNICFFALVGALLFFVIYISYYKGYEGYTQRTSVKIDNVLMLLNHEDESIYDLPHSPLVRIVETVNISCSIAGGKVLGGGFGAYFTDNCLAMPKLNEFDFSEDQISERKFFTPHNFNYGFLKYGVVYLIGAFFLFYSVVFGKLRKAREKKVYASFIVFSFFNFGFTYYPSVMLGIALSILIKKRKH
ncbi:MAG: hypothetical protein GYB17_09565 [Gammaproteobacteria bacterium]|nr:hypothetical protein [Gammaproteobacteria bacterium]